MSVQGILNSAADFLKPTKRQTMFAQRIVPADDSGVTDHIDAFVKQICEVIVGKNQAVKLAVACLLARGHLLIEDIPGVGKTTLSQAVARSIALAFQRLQFTSDLLPADILGNSIFDRDEQQFVFHRGPLFSQVVLIDEVNRATPKTQSALLEAMEEHHISIDGVTYELGPFSNADRAGYAGPGQRACHAFRDGSARDVEGIEARHQPANAGRDPG
jgi:replication-associated recombination protein RarA